MKRYLNYILRKISLYGLALLSFIPGWQNIGHLIYKLAIRKIIKELRKKSYVRRVILTGSVSIEDCIYGISDIDLIIIVRGRTRRKIIQYELRDMFMTIRRRYPFIGAVHERAGNVFFEEDLERDPYAAIYTSRLKKPGVKILLNRPSKAEKNTSFSQSKWTPDEIIAEITTQLSAVANTIYTRELNYYFWKSKLRALFPLLYIDSWPSYINSLNNEHEIKMANYLATTPNHHLYLTGKNLTTAGIPWKMMQNMINQILEEYHIRQLPTIDVEFTSTAARQQTRYRSLPSGVRGHWYSNNKKAFSGHDLMTVPQETYSLLQAETDEISLLAGGIKFSSYDQCKELTLLWQGDFVYLLEKGKCYGVFTRWDRPYLFPDNITEKGHLRFTSLFLDKLIDERDIDKQFLRDCFYWRFYPETNIEQSSAAVDRIDASLRYFEMRDRVLDGFAVIHQENNISHQRIVNFGSRLAALENAADTWTDHQELLELLASYSIAVERRTLQTRYSEFPPALMRAGIRFFSDLLSDAPIASDYGLRDRLGLSFCICTKNRSESLRALLNTVLRQTHLPDEIVIIDNDSTDDTPSTINWFTQEVKPVPVIHIIDKADTISKLRQRAVQESKHEIICFTDDDCMLHDGWFHFIEESFFLEDKIGAVGGLMCHFPETDTLIDFFHQKCLGIRL